MSVPEVNNGVSHGKVCLLMKSMFRLREAPRIWYYLLPEDLNAIVLEAITSDPRVFL